MKKIGIDFDNTIVIYDELFYKVALERNLIPINFPKNKLKIRNYLRKQNKENEFTNIQSEVYGKRIIDANAAPNIFEALKKISNDYEINIISHKTKYPYAGEKYNLHIAAINWLEKNKFLSISGLNIKNKDIYFLPTKDKKLAAINALDYTYFVDDLPEILKYIKKQTHRILYLNNQKITVDKFWDSTLHNWNELPEIIYKKNYG